MAAAAILKHRKLAISWPRFDRFRPNLARLRSSALLSRPTVKNFKNLKIHESQHQFNHLQKVNDVANYSSVDNFCTPEMKQLLTEA